MNKDLKDKSLQELEQIVVEFGQPEYAARYIFSFVHAYDACEISQITALSGTFRKNLAAEGYYISNLKVLNKLTDLNGTMKFLFELQDGNRIEAVLLVDGRRITACVSSQVGCAMDCVFCATARIKFRRNLSAGEIVNQVNITAAEKSRLNNIVFMGMGEPMLNYDAVLKAVRILNEPSGKNIGARRITISTCGIVPAIKRLADEGIQLRLSVSLNAPTDALRTKLMPINAKYPLDAVLKAVDYYQKKTNRRVTFEYVLMDAVNDKPEYAKLLIKLLQSLKCNVNLIEHNPYPGCQYQPSTRQKIAQFAEVLRKAGVTTTVRLRMGRTINAACGQLGAGWIKGRDGA